MSRLPTVEINGKEYFRDARLREYRAVDNPHESIKFGETLTKKLRNGVTVLARDIDGYVYPFTFANRTQAAARVYKLGGDPWYVYKSYGRPFFVALKGEK